MKTLVLVCAVWVLGVAGVRADLTVVQKVEGLGQDMENTSRFKAGKTRVDTSPGTSLIMDLKTGEVINLMHAPKTFVRIFGVAARPAVENVKQDPGSPGDARPTLTVTGKTETISGYAADEYICTAGRTKIALWLTKALPDYEAALDQMKGAPSLSPIGSLAQSYGVDPSKLPGFPLRTVVELAPGQTLTRTVVSVSTKPLADSEFEIPPGYKEIAVPVLTPPAAAEPSPAPAR